MLEQRVDPEHPSQKQVSLLAEHIDELSGYLHEKSINEEENAKQDDGAKTSDEEDDAQQCEQTSKKGKTKKREPRVFHGEIIHGARSVAVILDRAMNSANSSWTKRTRKYSVSCAQNPGNCNKDDAGEEMGNSEGNSTPPLGCWKGLDWKERARRTNWSSKESMDTFFPLLKDFGQLMLPPFIVEMIKEPLVRAHGLYRWRRMSQDDQKALTAQCKQLTGYFKVKEFNGRQEEKQKLSEERKLKRDDTRNSNKRARREEEKEVRVVLCLAGRF